MKRKPIEEEKRLDDDNGAASAKYLEYPEAMALLETRLGATPEELAV